MVIPFALSMQPGVQNAPLPKRTVDLWSRSDVWRERTKAQPVDHARFPTPPRSPTRAQPGHASHLSYLRSQRTPRPHPPALARALKNVTVPDGGEGVPV